MNREKGLRERVIAALEDFNRRYAQSHILITCRIAASDYVFQNFQNVELADFNKKQIDAFAGKWFSDAPEKHQAFLREFYHSDNERLRELAATPILLTLLCLAFEDTPLRSVQNDRLAVARNDKIKTER